MHPDVSPPRPSFRHRPRARFARHFRIATGVLAVALLPSPARSADGLRIPKYTLFTPAVPPAALLKSDSSPPVPFLKFQISNFKSNPLPPPPPPEPVSLLPATFAPVPALTPQLAPAEPILPEKVAPLPRGAAPAVTRPAATVSNNVPFPLEARGKSSTNLLSQTDARRQLLKQKQPAEYQIQLDLARQHRREKNAPRAISLLVELLEGDAPVAFKRPALYELALAHHEDRQLVRAQQIFAQYLKLYDDDPMTPEIFLRQGMIFRELGVATLAIGKFYAVMTSALNLQQDQIDYYKTLVLHAQTEIADTYFQQAKFTEAADFYQRLLQLPGTELNRPQIQFKLLRSLAQLDRHLEAIVQGQALVARHPDVPEVPETRYQIAMSLKALNRNNEALQEVLALLQSQQSVAAKDPANRAYWQQRAGNEIANHLYQENDNLNALVIYQNLAQLSPAAAWQLPAWYQTGLVYERLRQPEKALETYARILQRAAEADPKASPGLAAVVDMARWRKDYLTWHGAADTRSAALRPPALAVGPLPFEPISVAALPPADSHTPLATPTFSPIGSPGTAPNPGPAPKNNPPLTPPK